MGSSVLQKKYNTVAESLEYRKPGVKYLIYFWMLYCKHPQTALVF